MTISPVPDEIDILRRMQTGDESAFSIVYRHYYPFVHAKVLRLLHSPELSDDVTQEIFIKIWESRSKLAEVKSFTSYLFITARNHSINVLKSAARKEEGMGEIIRHFNRVINSTEDALLNKEYLAFTKRKLDELPPRSREVFRLCREESKSYSEVAAALGITREAVKSRMVHVMKVLRNSAENELGFPLAVILALFI